MNYFQGVDYPGFILVNKIHAYFVECYMKEFVAYPKIYFDLYVAFHEKHFDLYVDHSNGFDL